MYGPVRTVVWQGSAGDRGPYADQISIALIDNQKGETKRKLVQTPDFAKYPGTVVVGIRRCSGFVAFRDISGNPA